MKTFQNRILLNVGSVGNPLDLSQASYAILEGAYASAVAAPFAIQFVRVPYDIEGEIAQAEAMRMLECEAYAIELRTGPRCAYG